MLKRTKQLRRRVLIEEGLAKSSKKQHSQNTDRWHLCKAGGFSYGESPWTPPLEGTSLHRRNNSVERPWGILSLFTTCLLKRAKPLSDNSWAESQTITLQKSVTHEPVYHLFTSAITLQKSVTTPQTAH